MNTTLDYRVNIASASQIADHLLRCDVDFVPPLSDRVAINEYAIKIATKATRFEAYSDGVLIGLVAAYMSNLAYITNVSVVREWTGKGIASCLVSQLIEYAQSSGIQRVVLEVASANTPAIKLYERIGFNVEKSNDPVLIMTLSLASGSEPG